MFPRFCASLLSFLKGFWCSILSNLFHKSGIFATEIYRNNKDILNFQLLFSVKYRVRDSKC